MASFGAKYPYFNPVAEEPEGQLPVYKDQDPVRIGRLVKADLTVNLASGKLFADDGLAESVEEFFLRLYRYGDRRHGGRRRLRGLWRGGQGRRGPLYHPGRASGGGLAYFKKLMRRKKVIYKGYFYPLVMASLGNDTAQTKGDSITFGTNNTTFTVFACEDASWRHTKEFPSEAEALAWIKDKLKGKKKAATPTATPAAGAVASGATVALASTTENAVIHYTTDGSDPTETSPAYSSPIEITAETTIKAIATAEGFAASDVLEAHYTLTA